MRDGGTSGGAQGEVDRELRRRVARDAGVVAVALLGLAVATFRLDALDLLTARAGPTAGGHVREVLVLLGLAHVVMLVFGQRRGADLRRESASRQEAEEVLRHRATHDALTGALDREALTEAVEAELRAVAAGAGRCAVLLVDLDRSKEVNDTLGHHVGDELLRGVVRRMDEALGGAGLLARMGGDEFGVLLPRVDARTAVDVGRRVQQSVRRPPAVDGLQLEVDASVGVATSPEDGDDVDELLRRADVAMYTAKSRRAGVVRYEPGLDEGSRDHRALYGELRRAVEGGELRVHYQSQVAVGPHGGFGRVVGVEALVRWQHPRRGLPQPGDFLGVAEQSGLVGPLTEVVLDVDLGVGLAVDDYGTGHASLSYVSRLPVTSLKIDRSFVQAMEDTRADRAVVRSTIDLARELGLEVVAEGVETQSVLDGLSELGCDHVPGFLLSRPVPAEELPGVLARLGRDRPAAGGPAAVPLPRGEVAPTG